MYLKLSNRTLYNIRGRERKEDRAFIYVKDRTFFISKNVDFILVTRR